MHLIDASTQLCAVIGNPVEHSLSPAMHNAAFESLNLNYVYLAFRVEDLAGCMAGMRAMASFRGMSVTIPHKIAIMQYLDDIEPMAQHVGCVNTVTRENDRLTGSITDGVGALRAFEQAGISLDGRRILFVGAGGAVRAVAFAFAELARVDRLTILGRTSARVAALVNDLRARTPAFVRSGDLSADLAEALTSHDIIIQGTPIGMFPHNEESPIPSEFLRPEHIVFDMVYRPLKTRLVRAAEDRGCKVILGLEMLVHQATLQFERWTGVPAPLDVMRAAVIQRLQQE